jgi:hypothetical protein
MIVADFDPGLTVAYRFSAEPFIKTRSPAAPTGIALPLSVRDLLWEVNNSSTWIKAPFSTPTSQASSTYWPSPSSEEELTSEEHILAPFQPNATIRVTMRMRYVGQFQPEDSVVEEDWLE